MQPEITSTALWKKQIVDFPLEFWALEGTADPLLLLLGHLCASLLKRSALEERTY